MSGNRDELSRAARELIRGTGSDDSSDADSGTQTLGSDTDDADDGSSSTADSGGIGIGGPGFEPGDDDRGGSLPGDGGGGGGGGGSEPPDIGGPGFEPGDDDRGGSLPGDGVGGGGGGGGGGGPDIGGPGFEPGDDDRGGSLPGDGGSGDSGDGSEPPDIGGPGFKPGDDDRGGSLPGSGGDSGSQVPGSGQPSDGQPSATEQFGVRGPARRQEPVPGGVDPRDVAGGTSAAIEAGQDSPLGNLAAGAGGFSRDVARGTRENVIGPTAAFLGDLSSRGVASVEAVRQDEFTTGPAQFEDGAANQTEQRVETLIEGLGGGAVGATIGAPGEAARLGQLGLEGTQFTAQAVEEEGVGEGLETGAEAGADVGQTIASQTVEQAQEDPIGFTAGLAGGLIGGVGSARVLETATGRLRTGIEGRGGPDIDATDTTRQPEQVEAGEQPTFETGTGESGDVAAAEFRERSAEQPEALQEAAESEQVVLRSESGRLPGDVDVEQGQSELPGLFTSSDFAPLRFDTGDGGGSLRPRLPRLFSEPERASAFEAPDIDAIPEEAAGSGRVFEGGEFVPDPDTAGAEFLSEQAERGTAFVRPSGDRTSELEAIFPPRSRFERVSTGTIEAGGTRGTLDVFRRADDQPDAPRGRGDLEGETMTAEEIASRSRGGGTPDGQPVSPFGVSPDSGGSTGDRESAPDAGSSSVGDQLGVGGMFGTDPDTGDTTPDGLGPTDGVLPGSGGNGPGGPTDGGPTGLGPSDGLMPGSGGSPTGGGPTGGPPTGGGPTGGGPTGILTPPSSPPGGPGSPPSSPPSSPPTRPPSEPPTGGGPGGGGAGGFFSPPDGAGGRPRLFDNEPDAPDADEPSLFEVSDDDFDSGIADVDEILGGDR